MKRLVFCTLLLIWIPACGPRPASQLLRLSRGMVKSQVMEWKVLGAPNSIKGVIQNKHGELVEVWEYRLEVRLWAKDRFWLYFVDDKLLRWTESEDKDWPEEEQRIYETRFAPE